MSHHTPPAGNLRVCADGRGCAGRPVALTIYTVAQTLVLNNVRTLRHVEPLWFANIANNILWFTFVKAGFRSALALVGAPPPAAHTPWAVGSKPSSSNAHGHFHVINVAFFSV